MTPTSADLLTRHAPPLDPTDDPSMDAVLARVLSDDRPRRALPAPRVRRRLVLGAAGVAALTAGGVVLPAALRRDDAGVQALQRIAVTAGSRPATVLAPGTYLHLVTIENPDGREFSITGSPGRDVYPRRLESWTAADGTIWRRDSESSGLEEFWRFDPPVPGGARDVGPATLAALPRDGEALLRSLRRRLPDHEPDGQAFRYLEQALRVGYAPPPVQRALVDALSRLPVSGAVRSRTQDGRPCLRVTFTSAEQDGLVSYVCFDEATAEFLESGDVIDGRTVFASVVTVRDRVDEVPAEVVEKSAGSPQG